MRAERFGSALWETSSLLLEEGGEAVLVDPGISREEVERIAARADELGARVVCVLATHADWDHVCGIAAFPGAEAAMGELAAERVASGDAGRKCAQQAERLGLELTGPPRVDRRLVPGRAHRLGPFLVETLALPGHTPDGLGYRIRALDLLAVGDHLSPLEFPFVSDPAAYRTTLVGLAELLRRDPPRRVVVGHGPELGAAEALALAEADLDYLWSLHADVLAGGDGLSVAPPRPAEDAEEMHAANAAAQVSELRS